MEKKKKKKKVVKFGGEVGQGYVLSWCHHMMCLNQNFHRAVEPEGTPHIPSCQWKSEYLTP